MDVTTSKPNAQAQLQLPSDALEAPQEVWLPKAVNRLLEVAVALGLDERCLDDLVLDDLHRRASKRGPSTDADRALSGDQWFDHVHDQADYEFAEINASGLRGQIEYLTIRFGPTEVDAIIREMAATAPDYASK